MEHGPLQRRVAMLSTHLGLQHGDGDPLRTLKLSMLV